MPLGAAVVVQGGGGEAGAQVFAAEEQGDHGADDDGAQDGERGVVVRLGDDEVDVARIGRAAPVAASHGHLHAGRHFGEHVAHDAGVGVDFRARDARQEVAVVGDADFLVFGQGRALRQVGEGAVSLVDPGGGLRHADAVDLEEELQGEVARFEGCVVEAAEAVGPDDFFDLLREPGADGGDRDCFFLGHDFEVQLSQSRDGPTVSWGLPFVVFEFYRVVVVCHLLENFNGSAIGVLAFVEAVMLVHAIEFLLVKGSLLQSWLLGLPFILAVTIFRIIRYFATLEAFVFVFVWIHRLE